jgi:YVTN family beta-propeller protein
MVLVIAGFAAPAFGSSYVGPVAVLGSKDGNSLMVACRDARYIAVIDIATQKVVRTIDVPGEPTGMVLSADGASLYVTCAAEKSTVCVIDVGTGAIAACIPAGHTATGAAIAPDGKRLYVCNRFDNNVSVIDLATRHEIAKVPAVREPHGAVVTPDGTAVFVVNHLPLERSDSLHTAAVVTMMDAASHQTAVIRLPNGSSSVRGLCISPDGKYVYVPHILAHYQMPATHLQRGWMNTNALSIIDAGARQIINTVLLDEVDLGAANPWGVTTTADGATLCVSHAGTHELSVIDVPALMAKLAKISATAPDGEPAGQYGTSTAPAASKVLDNLSFLVGLRRRIKLQGNGPRGLTVIGSKAYVAEYFTDTLGVVDLASRLCKPAAQIPLGPKPQWSMERRGEVLFHDATICFQHWQSCESCHPDCRMDGFNWDLTNDGLGNPKNTRSMLNAHRVAPVMSLGVRETAEEAVRVGITRILFSVRPEEDALAIDEFLKSLKPVPSPHLVDGKLSPSAQRGKRLFFDQRIGCGTCHPEPYYTDQKAHDVGSRAVYDKPSDKFNTPRLNEVWRTAPYLHDGRCLSTEELLRDEKHGGKHGELDALTQRELEDLIEFVLSL